METKLLRPSATVPKVISVALPPNFATRYAYSNEDIENLAQLAGFRIIEVRRKELPTSKGDENLYYVLEKM